MILLIYLIVAAIIFLVKNTNTRYRLYFVDVFAHSLCFGLLTILKLMRVSSSFASSCFFFSGSSVSSFLYFLLLLKKGANNDNENVLGDIFSCQWSLCHFYDNVNLYFLTSMATIADEIVWT